MPSHNDGCHRRTGRHRQLALSQAEKRVLEQPLKIGFAPNAAPLSFTGEDGRPSGLASEYQRLMQAGANLQVEDSHDWYEVREKARRGELQAVMGIPVDSRYLGPDWVFSQPFISVPNVIVVRSDGESLLGLADLQGKRVLLSDPERVRGYVLQQAPQARIIAARSAEQSLQRLLAGDADAYIGNLAVVDHLLRSRFPGGCRWRHRPASTTSWCWLWTAATRHWLPPSIACCCR